MQKIEKLLKHDIGQCKILVIGDIMLDRYFYGEVTRISPEAPVPINRVQFRKDTLGGAANVAHNLAKLGCKTYVSGVVGEDTHCGTLRNILNSLGIESNGLIFGRNKTTTKIRILSGHQQMLRLDFEETNPIEKQVENQLIHYIQSGIQSGIDGIIISDYLKGVCTDLVCRTAIDFAHSMNIPVFIDPKGKQWKRYSGCDYITPNVKEMGEVIGRPIQNIDMEICKAADFIRANYGIKNILATRSEKGMSLFRKGITDIHIPTFAQEVFDVSGAGDTVIAVFATAISCHINPPEAARLADLAAGIGVGKVGTYAVSCEEILSHINNISR